MHVPFQALPRYEEASLALIDLYTSLGMNQEALDMAERARLAAEEGIGEEGAEGVGEGKPEEEVKLHEIFSPLGLQRFQLYRDHDRDDEIVSEFLSPLQAELTAAAQATRRAKLEQKKQHDLAREHNLLSGIPPEMDHDSEQLALEDGEPPRKKGRRRKKKLLSDSVDESQLVDLIETVAKKLVRKKRYEEATKLVRTALDTDLFPHTESEARVKNHETLRFLDVAIRSDYGDHKGAWSSMKLFCLKMPESKKPWCILNKIAIRAGTWNLNHKQLVRQLNKFKDSVPMGVLVAHHCAVAGSFRLALGQYYRAYRSEPDEPLLSLCIGITLLRMAMQKLTPNRHKVVLEAMAFMHQYARLRSAPAESDYNIARAYHQIALYHFAISSYQKVLNRSEAPTELKRSAAVNLSLIYRKSGATGLAAQLLQEYVAV